MTPLRNSLENMEIEQPESTPPLQATPKRKGKKEKAQKHKKEKKEEVENGVADEVADADEAPVPTPKKKAKREETEQEKLTRRKMERRKRQLQKQIKKIEAGDLGSLCSLWGKRFAKVFDAEEKFVQEVQLALPEVRNPNLMESEDDLFLLEEEDAKKTEKKRLKFLDSIKKMKEERSGEEGGKPLTHDELKERLHAKIAALQKPANEKKRLRKQMKKQRKKEEKEATASKKKFTSKANPNLKNQQKSGETISSGEEVKDAQKTPLVRKKPVVKENGEIVFSKFDFISEEKRGEDAPKKPKAEDLLRKVQKTESKLSNLEARGKLAEAEGLVQEQKWSSALKRASGEKIRDDPNLLKKTIKKQEKKKQVSKKKWQERIERVEKAKDSKQEKRQANLATRKEEKVKKIKKQLRKKGRLL